MAGHQRDYILWLLRHCVAEDADGASLIDEEAINLLAARLKTPLQIEQYLTLAFEETFRVGEKLPPLSEPSFAEAEIKSEMEWIVLVVGSERVFETSERGADTDTRAEDHPQQSRAAGVGQAAWGY